MHTVIHYTILNTERLYKIEKFRVLGRIKSDHMPLYNRLRYKTKKQRGKELNAVKGIIKWNEGYIRKYEETSSKKITKEIFWKEDG